MLKLAAMLIFFPLVVAVSRWSHRRLAEHGGHLD